MSKKQVPDAGKQIAPVGKELTPEADTAYKELEKKFQSLLAEKTEDGQFSKIIAACTELEKKCSALDETIKKYNSNMSTNIRGIWKGDIIGSNILDRQVNIDEIMACEKNSKGEYERILFEGTDNERPDIITQETVDNIQKSIDLWGSRLNMIAYERVESSRFFGLMENKGQYIVMAYDDQVLGMDDDGGNVALLCPGTIRYGRFEVPTGYPDRLKITVSEIHSFCWKDLDKNTISGISEITQKALEANPGFSQSVTMADANKPITIKRGKDE
jgi:hypothetical protein